MGLRLTSSTVGSASAGVDALEGCEATSEMGPAESTAFLCCLFLSYNALLVSSKPKLQTTSRTIAFALAALVALSSSDMSSYPLLPTDVSSSKDWQRQVRRTCQACFVVEVLNIYNF